MGRHFATCGTHAMVGSLKWIMRAQVSRLEAVVVASPVSLHLCSVCLHQWRVCLEIPLQSPPPQGGGRCMLRGEISSWGGIIVVKRPCSEHSGAGPSPVVACSTWYTCCDQ